MDARRRLFALLVALVCAMGWAPTASARTGEDRVVAGEGRGVLPGRPPETTPGEPSDHDDMHGGLPPYLEVPSDCAMVASEPAWRVAEDRHLARRVEPASPRGPPSIA